MFKKLNYGKKSLLIPILVIIATILGESFKEIIPFEIREQYGNWFYLLYSALVVLVALISMFLAVLSFFKKQSIIFGIIGIILDLPILAFFGWLLVLMIVLERISQESTITPRLH